MLCSAHGMRLHATTIFASAFLLLQVQPLLSKFVLPWFGGSPAVWTTCVLFFQVVLLLGYAYAHASARLLSPRQQARVHLVLLALALLFLPVVPSAAWKPAGTEDPIPRILLLLGATVGLPYFVLSTTGPLLQAWSARTAPDRSPYWLYALSNAGSFLALLSFPFAFEPLLGRRAHAIAWSAGFAVFALLCGLAAIASGRQVEAATAAPEAPPGPGGPTAAVHALWIGLAACPSALFLACTNQMCLDLASVPFLWVLTLGLYLLSFTLCFAERRFYRRGPFLVLLGAALAAFVRLLGEGQDVGLGRGIATYSAVVFLGATVCHGELYRLRPDVRHLTAFYLSVALGGALGGTFAGAVAPYVFPIHAELHLSLAGTGVLVLAAMMREWNLGARGRRQLVAGILAAVGTVLLARALLRDAAAQLAGPVALSRSFFGVLRLEARDAHDAERAYFRLAHGTTEHGSQYVAPARRRWPTTYYGESSGIGIVLRRFPRRGLRVGVVGLGAGTLATYGRKGDVFRFYEINPDVVRIARSYFTYLKNSAAACDVVLGDGRLSLESEPDQRYDVLVLDAFSSDAIPLHLLTVEAFDVYLRHLRPDGVVAVHASSRYLDPAPVVRALADRSALAMVRVFSRGDATRCLEPADWLILTRNASLLADGELGSAAARDDGRRARAWTDDHNDLLEVLRRS